MIGLNDLEREGCEKPIEERTEIPQLNIRCPSFDKT